MNTNSNNDTSTGPDFNALEQGIEALRTQATDAVNAAAERIAAGIEASAETVQGAAEATAATAEKIGEVAADAAQAATASTRDIDQWVMVTFFVVWSLLWTALFWLSSVAAAALVGPVGVWIVSLLSILVVIVPVTSNWLSTNLARVLLKMQDLVDGYKARKAAKVAQQKKNLAATVASFAEQATAAA